MKCPKCNSTSYCKSGRVKNRQRYLCKDCGRQFLEPNNIVVSDSIQKKNISKNGTLPKLSLQDTKILDSNNLAVRDLISKEEAKVTSKDSQEKVVLLDRNEVTILLLDAENIHLNLGTENFLEKICDRPIKIKIAFANWRSSSMSNRDIELHQRGYQLVHVPEGSNSADGKMIAVGSSIFLQYPDAKEVLICSNDFIFTNLCVELQNRSFTVHRVLREQNFIKVENFNTGKVTHYSLELNAPLPSIEDLLYSLEEIVQLKYDSAQDFQNKLSLITRLWAESKKISYFPVANSVVDETINTISQEQNKDNFLVADRGNYKLKAINSQSELEKAISNIFDNYQRDNPQEKMSISLVSKALKDLYGESGNQIVKRLKLKSNITKFLGSSSVFKIHESKIVKKNTAKENNSEKTDFNIEEALSIILTKLIEDLKRKYINISRLNEEFKKQYGKTVTQALKELNQKQSLLNFLKSRSVFEVKKINTAHYVTLI